MPPTPELNEELARIVRRFKEFDREKKTTYLDVRHHDEDVLIKILQELKEITFILQKIYNNTR
jgi:hypothetical protein